jgi:hypothetical protein
MGNRMLNGKSRGTCVARGLKIRRFRGTSVAAGFNLLQSLAQSRDVTVKSEFAQDVRRYPLCSHVTVAHVQRHLLSQPRPASDAIRRPSGSRPESRSFTSSQKFNGKHLQRCIVVAHFKAMSLIRRNRELGFRHAFVIDTHMDRVHGCMTALVRKQVVHDREEPGARECLDCPKPNVPSCLILDVRLRQESGLALQDDLVRDGLRIPV